MPTKKGSHEFSPALCYASFDDGRYNLKSGLVASDPRYDPVEAAERFGTIGCREWAWQLYHPANLLCEEGQPPRPDGLCLGTVLPETLPDGKKICGGLAEHSAEGVLPYINVTTYLKPDKKH